MNLKIVMCKLILVEILFFTNPLQAIENKNNREIIFRHGIVTAIQALGSDASFEYYDLHLSEMEIKNLKSIKINLTEQYCNYGNLKELNSGVNEFIKSLNSENKTTAETVSQIIVRIVKGIIEASGQETAWVALRSFTPTSSYDVPRWHTDGYYYEPYAGDPYKFVITLKGAPTLFYKLPGDKRKEFYTLQRKGTERNDYNRQAIAASLGNSKETISVAQPHQGAVFVVGSNHAAIHSEPSIKEERLFLSILPGSNAQIKEWKDKQD
ncbi:MAG: hypothetical protein BGO67_09505 [Alphaproteobacteria bacterium 41-28]|nr:MAG: hypothetical protein BGO67_09505 [Alphaproteobacteria bacterium 41-28]